MAKNLRIEGRVQGVGYRMAFEKEARALKLSGWVRNRRDGSVEAAVSGDAEALKEIIDWAWRGPSGARVSGIAIVEMDDALVSAGKFAILPTQ